MNTKKLYPFRVETDISSFILFSSTREKMMFSLRQFLRNSNQKLFYVNDANEQDLTVFEQLKNGIIPTS
jgi:hypothetical protein